MHRIRAAAPLLAAAMAVAACSGGGAATPGATAQATPAATPSATAQATPAATPPPSAAAGAATVALADTALGKVLVGRDGRTLYLFTADSEGTSACTGDCLATWPALTTDGAPTAGAGLDAGAFATITRDDGATQVTFHGHPLYSFAGDTAAGQTNGQGIGGKWFVVDATGTAVTEAAKPSESSRSPKY